MDISNFINMNENNLISKMKYSDKEKLLELLKEYKISLRDKLNINPSHTFGIEIEYDGEFSKIDSLIKSINYEWLKNERLTKTFWHHEEERSVPHGGEVISPILIDSVETWNQIKDICNLLIKDGCHANNRTAAHIHFGTQIIGSDIYNWLKFLKLYATYENILFRFGYGEYERDRPNIISHSNPIAYNFLYTYKKYINAIKAPSFNELIRSLLFTYKTDAITMNNMINGGTSFKNGRTIEFRCPNGTLEPIIWQNNVNLFYHLLKYSTSNSFNEDIIDKRISLNRHIGNLNYYNEIEVNQAIELSDLIFDNNLDKINFLRQYFKDFKSINKFIKTKEFIKK